VASAAAVCAAAGWAMSQVVAPPLAPPATTEAGPTLPALQPLPAHPVTDPTALSLLMQPVPDTLPNAEQVRRGQSLVIAADCMSCHLRPGGRPFAGGLGLNTPFGVIYSPNITSDVQTGVGSMTPDQFHRVMHDGIGPRGANIYPAFPYPWFTRISRADNDAILAYLKTTPPVSYRRPGNKLNFPFNFRFLVKGWNLLFFRRGEFQPSTAQSAEWNRGAFLVNGPGHCGGCHTPKNAFGADRGGHALRGGTLDNWNAPDLTGNPRLGLGAWSVDDITEYLRTGRNRRAAAGGAMAEVVTLSTSLMNDADRHAIAVYLKSQAPSPNDRVVQVKADVMKRGGAIYSDACASCHLENGVGQPRFFPPLPHNAVAQQRDPASVLRIVLAGSQIASTNERPSPLTMPTFAWKLSDQEVADVTTYIRNSWGNQAAPISASQVRKVRKTLDLDKPRLTAMSGDQVGGQ
jgi:mono/diheme cytochrome c family protein